jgi:hypothetical protein
MSWLKLIKIFNIPYSLSQHFVYVKRARQSNKTSNKKHEFFSGTDDIKKLVLLKVQSYEWILRVKYINLYLISS